MSEGARKLSARAVTFVASLGLLSACAAKAPQWEFDTQPAFTVAGPRGAFVADPSLAWTPGGRLYVGVSQTNGESAGYNLYSTTADGDHLVKTGSAPVGPSMITGGQSGPVFILDRDEHKHLLWADEVSGTHHLTAMQRGWDAPEWFIADVRDKNISPKKSIAFGGISTGPHDDVYVSFLDERNNKLKDEDVSQVWFARAAGGEPFARNVRIAGHTCACCRTATAAAPDGKTVYVAFRGNYETDVRDMAVATSHDGGRTFGKPVRLGPDGWKLHGCPESGPSLLAQGKRLYVVWFTLGTELKPTIRLAVSDDLGRTFSPAKVISGNIFDANHPRIAALTSDTAVVTFQGKDPSYLDGFGKTQAWVETVEGLNAGAPSAATPRGISIHDPVIAAANAQLVFVGAVAGDHVIITRGRLLGMTGLRARSE